MATPFDIIGDAISDAFSDAGQSNNPAAKKVEDRARQIGTDITGGLGSLLGIGNAGPIPTFQQAPMGGVKRATQNFQQLFDAPATQVQQVQGLGPIAGQIPTVTPQQIRAAQMATGGIGQARNFGTQSRAQQQGAIDLQRQAALGAVPSAAQIQSRQALDSAMRNQLALASSARGGAAQQAAAQRQAQMGIGTLQQQGIANTAALRAQEQAAARAGLVAAIEGQRGQDAGLQQIELQQAGAQAQLNQQALLANQSAGLQGGVANQGAVLAGLQADQANQFRVESANQQAGLQGAGIDLQRQLGGAQGVLGVQPVAAQIFQFPQSLQAQIDAAQRAGQAALAGSVIEAGAGIAGKAFG